MYLHLFLSISLQAVSYTHLDVYKRQELNTLNITEKAKDCKENWKYHIKSMDN